MLSDAKQIIGLLVGWIFKVCCGNRWVPACPFPTRAEDALLWLPAADPPPRWMAKAELCLDSSGEAERGMFQVRENSKEKRVSPSPEDVLPVAFHLFSLFITFKHCAGGLGVSVTNDQTKTCLAQRVSAQGQCKYVEVWFYVVPKLIITPYISFALTKLFSFPLPRVSEFQD